MVWRTSIQRGDVVYGLACRRMKVVGKPYEEEPHVRFDVAGGGNQDRGPRRHSLTLQPRSTGKRLGMRFSAQLMIHHALFRFKRQLADRWRIDFNAG